jgi:hypothetical protein
MVAVSQMLLPEMVLYPEPLIPVVVVVVAKITAQPTVASDQKIKCLEHEPLEITAKVQTAAPE